MWRLLLTSLQNVFFEHPLVFGRRVMQTIQSVDAGTAVTNVNKDRFECKKVLMGHLFKSRNVTNCFKWIKKQN